VNEQHVLTIERLGQRGEGVARTDQGNIFVPYTVPGDTISAEVDGDSARLIGIIKSSPDREAPFCPYYGTCGGCAIQGYREEAYREWKRALVVDALARAGVDATVDPLIDAHGAGRRRATFHARFDSAGHAMIGFMAARSHDLVAIDFCPLFAPSLDGAIAAARAMAEELARVRKPLDILVTGTPAGLDIDVRGAGSLNEKHRQALIAAAERFDLARLSNHGRLLIERRPTQLQVGRALVHLPPGAFLQATAKGEATLAELVGQAANSKRVADLFCGIGTFALRLAERAEVLALDGDAAALSALTQAARAAPGLRTIRTERRDLMRRPLPPEELAAFDAVIFDPPRAGAEAQAHGLAKSHVPLVIAVSCNAQTFARDAAILIAPGYKAERITPVDQFRQSPHVEIVGIFRRAAAKGRARRSLLSG
jgi:23S rRNA (uracil1939-C5)-methyltransferase